MKPSKCHWRAIHYIWRAKLSLMAHGAKGRDVGSADGDAIRNDLVKCWLAGYNAALLKKSK